MTRGELGDELLVRLLERRLTKVTADGRHQTWSTVHCPKAGSARNVVDCQLCECVVQKLSVLGVDFLECRVSPKNVARGVAGELIGPKLTVLDCEVPAATALAVLEAEGVLSAPVVDDNHVLVGAVTTAALARLTHDPDAEVEDAMTSMVVAVNQRNTVAELAQVMADHDLDRVAVVGDGARLLGVVTAVDVVRWYLERDGAGRE